MVDLNDRRLSRQPIVCEHGAGFVLSQRTTFECHVRELQADAFWRIDSSFIALPGHKSILASSLLAVECNDAAAPALYYVGKPVWHSRTVI
jgi:hypothetical protein